MPDLALYVGKRLSLKSQACTVRYVGQVDGKSGNWLGVEWDDPRRGKHDGSHEGKRYFTCRSNSPTAASFVRPKQEWDKTRSFLDALEEKYFHPEDAQTEEVVFVSRSKQIEEIGFDKFARRQAELRGIHVIVLDHMQIRHQSDPLQDANIRSTCANITDLDVGHNLFETFEEFLSLCSLFPKLRQLTIDGNRFSVNLADSQATSPADIRSLSMSDTLCDSLEVEQCLKSFRNVKEVRLEANELSKWYSASIPSSISRLEMSRNAYTVVGNLSLLLELPNVTFLSLKDNRIDSIMNRETQAVLSRTLQDLDLSRNDISSWRVIDALNQAFPALADLRVSGNPLYENLQAADLQSLPAADGYMLTVARLPRLQSLNHSKITEQTRLNAEKYYLGRIVSELSTTTESAEPAILAQHPRWKALCDEYGTPTVVRNLAGDEIDPNSLAARLIEIEFRTTLGVFDGKPWSWKNNIPKSINVYALYGIAGDRLGEMPLDLQLIWETGERDPVAASRTDFESWDSSDDDNDDDGEQWTLREVNLVPGTRPLATYFEGRTAIVRVERAVDKAVRM